LSIPSSEFTFKLEDALHSGPFFKEFIFNRFNSVALWVGLIVSVYGALKLWWSSWMKCVLCY